MYKSFKYKKYNLQFHIFPKTAKKGNWNNVYLSGIRNWVADDSYNYSIVIGTFRIILTINRNVMSCCN